MNRYVLPLLISLLSGCDGRNVSVAQIGNPEQGRELLWRYGCGACHHIPGVQGAQGDVGPPLKNIARRVYIAGVLPNNSENLVHFIRAPQRVDPLTAMPDLGVTEAHASDMAAYLYSLD
jgi:cytochrome c